MMIEGQRARRLAGQRGTVCMRVGRGGGQRRGDAKPGAKGAEGRGAEG